MKEQCMRCNKFFIVANYKGLRVCKRCKADLKKQKVADVKYCEENNL